MSFYESVDPKRELTDAARLAIITRLFALHMEVEPRMALVPIINHNKE